MSCARLAPLLALALLGCVGGWQGPAYGEVGQEPEPVDDVEDVIDDDGDGVAWPLDCHDGEPAIFPGNPEVCDGLDNDCSGAADDLGDADLDGFSACEDCDDDDAAIHPEAAELCGDGLDDDCDGAIDEDAAIDDDGDGVAPCEGDCDDGRAHVYPGAPGDESGAPDGLDDDCDGLTDEAWDLPGLHGTPWVATDLHFGLLTGGGMTDLAISHALADFIPPASDLVALLLDPTSDVSAGPCFSALVGLGDDADPWAWRPDAPPLPTGCWLHVDGFECDPVDLLSIPLPGLEPLLLHDVGFAGELFDGTDVLHIGTIDAVLLPGELPSLPTPAGDLAELVAQRPFDVDSDGDGEADAWSTLLAFTPLESP